MMGRPASRAAAISSVGSAAGHQPLLVIRQHGDRSRRHGVARYAQQSFRQPRLHGRGFLAVGTQQLLAGRKVARFQRGDAAALHQQPGLDVGLAADQGGEIRACLIVANHRDERHRRAECGQVAHHVAGAARYCQFAIDRQDGDWRFRTDAFDLAIDVAVQHHVAHDQHAGAAKQANRSKQIGFRFG